MLHNFSTHTHVYIYIMCVYDVVVVRSSSGSVLSCGVGVVSNSITFSNILEVSSQ